eukprot:CAMPEP_0198506018 /NCGR_PEP_ID=MMETSP1462-20131121/11400_1 /TAXON_ID=1333877 /ORGANISM="Brandtodinium nutriculum, Strain RCC3387" /LENGTH=282 /DNA_ID=CAMNT_0044235221 /DNA_START=27 /DNA_END=875 /DNA_ORIENTATION=+
MCRGGVADADKPEEMTNLKVVETRFCKFPEEPVQNRRRGQGRGGGANGAEDEEEYISEGEHGEATGPASWNGRPRSWWRVHNQLGEELLVREGVSLRSASLRKVSPGELVQQAGHARTLTHGIAKGCIRLPVRPSGWVTADATKAGGPKFLVRASVPRWRVVWPGGKDGSGVIVREVEELNSGEVATLHRGDVVEQAGPSVSLPDGIVRMPVTSTIIRRADQENAEEGANGHEKRPAVSGKTAGWVTVDASAAGGPVFFKPVAEADRNEKQQQRRRRPKPGM